MAAAGDKIVEYYLLIHEHAGFHIPFEVTHRVGPYYSREDAIDMYWVGWTHCKPEYDDIGRDVIWDYEIEEIEVDDHSFKCAC